MSPSGSGKPGERNHHAMDFIQIIGFETDKIDEIRALDDEWQRASAGKRSTRRTITTTDRDNPGRHMLIVFFDSY